MGLYSQATNISINSSTRHLIQLLIAIPLLLSGLSFLAIDLLANSLKATNPAKRAKLLKALAIDEYAPDHQKEVPLGGRTGKRVLVVGFFHPYCNAGGGGERVLWVALKALQCDEPEAVAVVYTGDVGEGEGKVTKDEILAKVKARFDISLDPARLVFFPLKRRYLVEDKQWSRFTLALQSIASVFLALEGLQDGIVPDVWIDTMGYAFAYPLVKRIAKCPVGSYTHYPTISTDMLRRVKNRTQGHTNTSAVANSQLLTYVKLAYYHLFALVYARCLNEADVLMVNSTWTANHINALLGRTNAPAEEQTAGQSPAGAAKVAGVAGEEGLRQRKGRDAAAGAGNEKASGAPSRTTGVKVLYPPCDTGALAALSLDGREDVILSVAQFRPEKEHDVQLRALKLLFDRSPQYKDGPQAVKLVMAGSVRGGADEARVEKLKALAKELGVQDSVTFAINVAYPALVRLFATSSIGLHTMVDEHFGITVVELMAAGLIPIAHASAGPLLDIVTPVRGEPAGLLARDVEEFAERLAEALGMGKAQWRGMRERAREASGRFGEGVFVEGWRGEWEVLKGKALAGA